MQVDISYQTLHLPPPYAFAYTLRLDFTSKDLKVDFELEYLNREELSEEEILDEGYSLDSSFAWKGSLDQVWGAELKAPILQEQLHKETEEANTWIHFKLDNGKEGIVSNPDEWEYRLQELIQAIYEKAGYENPLVMKFIDRYQGKSGYYELKGSFAHRSCQVNDKSLTWQQMQNLMSEVFSMDFEGGFVKNPTEDGLWIDPDGLSGYQAVHQMAGKKAEKVSKKILALLQEAK